MILVAVALTVSQALSSSVSVIIRHLRDMHWAALSLSSRVFSVLELLIVCAILGLFCIPNCDFDRLMHILRRLTVTIDF